MTLAIDTCNLEDEAHPPLFFARNHRGKASFSLPHATSVPPEGARVNRPAKKGRLQQRWPTRPFSAECHRGGRPAQLPLPERWRRHVYPDGDTTSVRLLRQNPIRVRLFGQIPTTPIRGKTTMSKKFVTPHNVRLAFGLDFDLERTLPNGCPAQLDDYFRSISGHRVAMHRQLNIVGCSEHSISAR